MNRPKNLKEESVRFELQMSPGISSADLWF